MIRNDFVSNSSSSSFIVALTDEEVQNARLSPKTVLDFILRYNWNEIDDPIPDPKDSRYEDWRYRSPWSNRKIDIEKPDMFDEGICPWIYQQRERFKITNEQLDKYLNCCNNCTDKKSCIQYKLLLNIKEKLNQSLNVYAFELDSSNCNIPIEDGDFANIKDPHVISYENNH